MFDFNYGSKLQNISPKTIFYRLKAFIFNIYSLKLTINKILFKK